MLADLADHNPLACRLFRLCNVETFGKTWPPRQAKNGTAAPAEGFSYFHINP